MIVFDLDGTLADCSHRQHLVHNLPRGTKPQWDEFFAQCTNDKPIGPVIDVFVAALKMYGLGNVQIWSGRSAAVQQQTHQWLHDHVGRTSWVRIDQSLWPKILTRMRPEGDHTPDDELKERWLKIELELGNSVGMVFDDRDKVVAMWRRHGIICAQVQPGDF